MNLLEPHWLEVTDVIEIAATVVGETGEPFHLRESGLLESAVMAPRNRWHYEDETDRTRLGLALAVSLARNHPFEQGNKRAAWFSMLAFFMLNRVTLKDGNDPYFADLFIDVITGERSPEDLLGQMILIPRE